MKKLLCRTRMFDEAREAKAGRGLIIEILIFLLVFIIASSVESVIISIPMMVWIFTGTSLISDIGDSVSQLTKDGDFGAYIDSIMQNVTEIMSHMPDWLMILQLFATVAVTVTVILFCRLIQKRKLGSLGIRRGNAVREYLIGALAGIVMIAVCVAINLIAGTMTISTNSFSVPLLLLYLVGYMLQGASEEVLCRGYFMVSAARKSKLWVAAVANSLLFAALHLGNPGITLLAFLNLFICGCVFSAYVIKRGNLWGACALHSFWNFFQGNIFGVNVSGLTSSTSPFISSPIGSGLLNGGAFGIEGGLACTITEVAALLIILFVVPYKKDQLAD